MKKQFVITALLMVILSSHLPAFCLWTGLGDGIHWSDPGNWSCGHPPMMDDEVTITGHATTLDLTLTVKSFSLEGGSVTAMAGTELLEVKDGLLWTGGTIAANVTLKTGGTMAMVMAGAKFLEKKLILEVGTTCTWDAGDFFISGSGELDIVGEFGASFDGTIDFMGEVPGKIVTMGGKFVKAGGVGTLTVVVDYENAGTTDVMSGKLKLDGGMSTNSGDIIIAGGATLEIVDGSMHAAMASFAGAGTLEITGTGPHIFGNDYAGGLSLVFDSDDVTVDGAWSSSAAITISKGWIDGAGSITSGGSTSWTGGRIDLPFEVSVGATLTLSDPSDKVLTKVLMQKGTATWTGGKIIIDAPGSFKNIGTFDATIDKDITFHVGETPGSFVNSGTFKKSAGAGITAFIVPYTNTGSTDILTGTLQFDKTTSFSSGTLTISSGTILKVFGSTTFSAGSTIAGTGDTEWHGGTSFILTSEVGERAWTISGGSLSINVIFYPTSFAPTISSGILSFNSAINPASFSLTQSGGTVNVNADVEPTSASVTLSGGTLGGIGSLRLTDSFVWSGGTVDVPLTCTNACAVGLTGSGTKTLTANLTHNGTATWSDGTLAISSGSTWTNSSTFNASATTDMTGTGSFSNGGTFRKTTLGARTIEPVFTNDGTVKGIGTLSFPNGFTNNGTVAPGLSPGILTKTGDYTNGNLLDLEIFDGSGAGTGHDQLVVTNNATLAGTIKVTETGTVPNGSYTVLICQGTSPCISGSFSTIDLPTGYTLSMTATEVMVTKSVLPIELVDFTAQQEGDDVLLNWETASELDNDYFEIERSTDGHHFETIGEMAGHGTSFISHNYSFSDKNIFEKINGDIVYYRLRQIDFDGQFEYSKIVAVNLTNKNHSFFVENIFQNKSGLLEISINMGLSDNYHPDLFLYNLSGKLILYKHLILEKGKNDLQLSVGHLPEGIYLVNIKSAEKQFTERVFLK